MLMNYFNILLHNVENIYRRILIKKNCRDNLSISYQDIINNINTKSYHIKKNFLSKKDCDCLKNSLNKLIKRKDKNKYKYWHDSYLSDHRFWRFHKYNNLAKDFMNNKFINSIASIITGRKKHYKIVMANKLIFKKNNVGSGGGWHKDSPYRTQFKAFLYLDDVKINNGPLQILPGSHRIDYIKKLINFDIFPNQYRFPSNLMTNFFKKSNYKPISICGKAGTLIMANTKCIHRGLPIKKKNRYALTIYFGDPKLPNFI
jgi:hypothetical protein